VVEVEQVAALCPKRVFDLSGDPGGPIAQPHAPGCRGQTRPAGRRPTTVAPP
jgi:hypothetical protein